MNLTRRNFIKSASVAAGLLLLKPGDAVLAKTVEQNDDLAMLIDVTKCVSCWWCYAACKEYNRLPETLYPDAQEPPELSPIVWTSLTPLMPDKGLKTRKLACNHCTDAACVEVCPTGALSYNELGFVQYNKELCSGCGYCAEFCPFEIPQLDRNLVTGSAIMNKCTFCQDRIAKGMEPACAEACTSGAIIFGKRQELVEVGRDRVSSLKLSNPSATFYGDKELDGLHVMYVLDDTSENYGLPKTPQVSNSTVFRTLLGWVGIGASVVVLFGFGLNYLIARKRIAGGDKE